MGATNLITLKTEKEYSEVWKHFEKKVGSILPENEKYRPEFLVISPAKTCSTWLYNNLICHKDVLIKSKEMNYFSTFWQWYDINWYLDYFTGGELKCKGDVSGIYSLLPVGAIQYIHTLFPELKIVLSLRNPIERTRSQIKHYYRFRVGPFKNYTGRLSDITLSQFLNEFWLDSYYLWSDYSSIIKRWLSCISADNIHVNYTDAIEGNPKQVLHEIFQFLDIDPLVDMSAFPVNKRILKGLDIDIPIDIHEFFCSLFQDSLNQLDHVLRENFDMSFPMEWTMNKPESTQFDRFIKPGPLLPNRDVDHNSLPRFMESVNGYNILFYEGLFHGVSQRSGEINLHTWSEGEKNVLKSSGYYLVNSSPEGLKNLILKTCELQTGVRLYKVD